MMRLIVFPAHAGVILADIDRLIESIYTKTKEEKQGYDKAAIETSASEQIIRILVRSKTLTFVKR